MKNLQLIAAAAAFLLFGASNAMALSTETRDSYNTDGTAKFNDPDEQTPPMLAPPSANIGGNPHYSVGSSSEQSPTVPQMLGAGREGQQSFDRAFSHLGNQNQ